MKKRILVAEDEPLLAFDIAASLKQRGYEPIGPAVTLRRARDLLAAGVDGAIIDYDLNGEPADPLIADLEQLGLPFIVASGAMAHNPVAEGLRNLSFDKPMMSVDLVRALETLL